MQLSFYLWLLNFSSIAWEEIPYYKDTYNLVLYYLGWFPNYYSQLSILKYKHMSKWFFKIEQWLLVSQYQSQESHLSLKNWEKSLFINWKLWLYILWFFYLPSQFMIIYSNLEPINDSLSHKVLVCLNYAFLYEFLECSTSWRLMCIKYIWRVDLQNAFLNDLSSDPKL